MQLSTPQSQKGGGWLCTSERRFRDNRATYCSARQGGEDSNPHRRTWKPPCCLYITTLTLGPGPAKPAHPSSLASLTARFRVAFGSRSGKAGPPIFVGFAHCAVSRCVWVPVRQSRPTHLRSLRSLRGFALRLGPGPAKPAHPSSFASLTARFALRLGPGPAKPAHPSSLASLTARFRVAFGSRSGKAGPPIFVGFAHCAVSRCVWVPVRQSRPTHLRWLRSLRGFALRLGPGPAKPAHPSSLASLTARFRVAFGSRSGKAGPPIFVGFAHCAVSRCVWVPVRQSRPTHLRSLRSLRPPGRRECCDRQDGGSAATARTVGVLRPPGRPSAAAGQDGQAQPRLRLASVSVWRG